MIIQINTDKTISGDDKVQEYLTSLVKKSLKRYQSQITKIEVHLKDENGNKHGIGDMSCILEARLKGRRTIAVTNHQDSMELALTGAIAKTENVVEIITGRFQDHKYLKAYWSSSQ